MNKQEIDEAIFEHRCALKLNLELIYQIDEKIAQLEVERERIGAAMEQHHAVIGRLVAKKWQLEDEGDEL